MFPIIILAIDDGSRMYWNGSVGTNILQTYYWTVHGNNVTPEGTQTNNNLETDMSLGILAYNRTADLSGHSVILTGLMSTGNILELHQPQAILLFALHAVYLQ